MNVEVKEQQEKVMEKGIEVGRGENGKKKEESRERGKVQKKEDLADESFNPTDIP